MKTLVLLLGISLIGIIDACKIGKAEFKPHPTDCNKYYSIVGNKKHEVSCKTGLHFNDAKCLCDYPENVKTCKAIQCDKTKDKPYNVASETSCTEYYMCYKGNPLKQQCADGMEFDSKILKCIRATDSTCFINSCPKEEDNNKDIVFLPSKNCQEYYLCVKGNPVKQSCVKGTHWSKKNNRCEKPETAGCEKKKPDPKPDPKPEPKKDN